MNAVGLLRECRCEPVEAAVGSALSTCSTLIFRPRLQCPSAPGFSFCRRPRSGFETFAFGSRSVRGCFEPKPFENVRFFARTRDQGPLQQIYSPFCSGIDKKQLGNAVGPKRTLVLPDFAPFCQVDTNHFNVVYSQGLYFRIGDRQFNRRLLQRLNKFFKLYKFSRRKCPAFLSAP